MSTILSNISICCRYTHDGDLVSKIKTVSSKAILTKTASGKTSSVSLRNAGVFDAVSGDWTKKYGVSCDTFDVR